MKFFATLFATIASIAAVSAQAQSSGSVVSITSPLTGTKYRAGADAIISWINPTVTTITQINLAKGMSTSLTVLRNIANNVSATNMKYTWTVPKDLPNGDDYFFELGTSPNLAFAGPFTIEGGAAITSSSPTVTVSVSGTHIVTYTSYPTIISPTDTPDPDNTNKGAIIGGVVGGVAFLVIAGVAAFLLLRRRRRGTGESQRNSMNSEPNFDYNPYTSPTMIASNDNNSFSTANPRPFVQAYNPGQQYHPEYQHYDPYYSQQEPMMLPHRNVPDEADYKKPERHVPDEVPQQQK